MNRVVVEYSMLNFKDNRTHFRTLKYRVPVSDIITNESVRGKVELFLEASGLTKLVSGYFVTPFETFRLDINDWWIEDTLAKAV
jgi:hypothetical protein